MCLSAAVSLNLLPQCGHGIKLGSGTDETGMGGKSRRSFPSAIALLICLPARIASRNAFDWLLHFDLASEFASIFLSEACAFLFGLACFAWRLFWEYFAKSVPMGRVELE